MTVQIDWSFPRQVLYALLLVGGVSVYPLMEYGTADVVRAAIVGAILTTVNVLLGYVAIEASAGRSMTTFFKYVIGGMGIRLALMAVALIVLLKVFHLHALALVGSMGVFYMVFLTLEIVFIQKKVHIKQQS